MRTRSFISPRRSLTLASSSAAGTTTLNSRLRPSDRVSVTCMNSTLLTGLRFSFRGPCLATLGMVRAEGLEPPRLSSREPKSRASTNSATPAKGRQNIVRRLVRHDRGRLYAGSWRCARRAIHSTSNSRDTTKMAPDRRFATLSAPRSVKQRGIDPRQGLAEVLGDEAGAEDLGRLAMQPDGGAGRLEAGHALGKQPGHKPGQHVA